MLTRIRQVFRSLILYPDRMKWAVLNEIGKVPRIANLVTTVRLFRIAEISPPFPGSFQLFAQRMVCAFLVPPYPDLHEHVSTCTIYGFSFCHFSFTDNDLGSGDADFGCASQERTPRRDLDGQ